MATTTNVVGTNAAVGTGGGGAPPRHSSPQSSSLKRFSNIFTDSTSTTLSFSTDYANDDELLAAKNDEISSEKLSENQRKR